MSGKLSFSELDRRRQARGRGEERPERAGHPRNRYQEAKARGDALAAADALFGGEEARDLAEAVLTAKGRSERTSAAKELVERQGMPSAPHVLTQMLKISDEALVIEVLAALAEALAGASSAVREVAVRTAKSRGALVRDKELRLAIKDFVTAHTG